MVTSHYRFIKEFIDALEQDGVFLNPAQLQRLLSEARDLAQELPPNTGAPSVYAEMKSRLEASAGGDAGAPADYLRLFAQHLLDDHPVA